MELTDATVLLVDDEPMPLEIFGECRNPAVC